jgi:D-beta-D-heptose 7-phosphate kinase/D-beta-D-heptose 1-phosphate adenosyltransferase
VLSLSEIQSLLERAQSCHVACVGDLMVDRYIYGEADRISPEAPIPVMTRQRETAMLGAAGNVARNVAALGARVDLVGLVGDDQDAHALTRLIEAELRVEGHVVAERDRRTTVKTRFVASGQQLLRLDAEDAMPASKASTRGLIEVIEEVLAGKAAVLLSDYAKGVATPEVIAATVEAAAKTGAPIVVDPKGRSFGKYGRVRLIKPNARELSLTTDLPCNTDEEVELALEKALGDCEADAIVVTRAARGMSLAERGRPVVHVQGVARQVFDVSGAGDTALAALGVGLAAGLGLSQAVELAILASGVAVAKVGTAVVTPEELIEAEMAGRLAPVEAKVMSLDGVLRAVARWRAEGLKVGFTNGCFDILHRGHVSLLTAARGACDRLIVGLNTDASVRLLGKGDDRPVNDLESRALVLAGLASVDLVTPFDAPTPLALIEAIRPDVLIKGRDYTIETVVGADVVQAYGGVVFLAPIIEGYSTTGVIARLAGKGGA